MLRSSFGTSEREIVRLTSFWDVFVESCPAGHGDPARGRVASESGLCRVYVSITTRRWMGNRPGCQKNISASRGFPLVVSVLYNSGDWLLRRLRVPDTIRIVVWSVEPLRAACIFAAGSVSGDVVTWIRRWLSGQLATMATVFLELTLRPRTFPQRNRALKTAICLHSSRSLH